MDLNGMARRGDDARGREEFDAWLDDPDRSSRYIGPSVTYRDGSAWPVGVRPPMSAAMALKPDAAYVGATDLADEPADDEAAETEQAPARFRRREGRGRRIGDPPI
ncbi:hypothetical protein [Nocardia farcinica]|uniref:hypothetical protein n=1 Tax=Nocardia farcinica TaxID=37329 RepID=UPI0024537EBB|nr:hypothetical protein [Nocardia farcinica]